MNEEQVNCLLKLIDESVKSWHKLVDSHNRIANSMETIERYFEDKYNKNQETPKNYL